MSAGDTIYLSCCQMTCIVQPLHSVSRTPEESPRKHRTPHRVVFGIRRYGTWKYPVWLHRNVTHFSEDDAPVSRHSVVASVSFSFLIFSLASWRPCAMRGLIYLSQYIPAG